MFAAALAEATFRDQIPDFVSKQEFSHRNELSNLLLYLILYGKADPF